MKCACGCGKNVKKGNTWIKGHNNRFSLKLRQEMISRYQKGESATSIANSLDLYTTSVSRVLKRNGFELGHKKGKDHPNWKGGTVIKQGYKAVWNPEHPRANNVGYVKKHILVMERELGRSIPKDEHIHHINFDRLDNRPDNLWLCTNKQHQQVSSSIFELIKPLMEQGIIGFKEGGYYLK